MIYYSAGGTTRGGISSAVGTRFWMTGTHLAGPLRRLFGEFLGDRATDGARFIGGSITFKDLLIDTKKQAGQSRDTVSLK